MVLSSLKIRRISAVLNKSPKRGLSIMVAIRSSKKKGGCRCSSFPERICLGAHPEGKLAGGVLQRGNEPPFLLARQQVFRTDQAEHRDRLPSRVEHRRADGCGRRVSLAAGHRYPGRP